MFNKFKKLFGGKSTFSQIEKDYSINPDRDWKVILVVFFAINLILFFYLFITFRDISDESALNNGLTNTPSQILDEDALEKVLQIYSSREERMGTLLNTVPTSTDPSI